MTSPCHFSGCVLPRGHRGDHFHDLIHYLSYRFDRLEILMSDVAGIEGQALADLASAITDLTTRLGSLPQALADAQAALATALATDATDVAARDAALAQVQTNLDQATAISGQIESSVTALNAVAPAPPA